MVHETSSNVPELIEFHDVIYLIWHEAYPDKDYEALRNFVNDVNEYANKLYDAQLPGILCINRSEQGNLHHNALLLGL